MSDLPIVCTLTENELHERRRTLLAEVKSRLREVKELQRGYAFRFEAGDEQIGLLARMIDAERKCCQFLRFVLTVEPAGGPVWLEITGPAEAKGLVYEEFGPEA